MADDKDLHLTNTQVGFNIGTTLPANFTPAQKSSVTVNPTYDDNNVLQTATLKLTIPLDVSDAAIISPIKMQDGQPVRHEINAGQIGIDGGEEIFDSGSAIEVQNFIAIDTDGAGYLHVKIPVVIALKIEQLD